MNAAVLTIGDELLQGFTVDTNSSWLGTTLLPYNIQIRKKNVVGDNLNDIISETQNILNDKVISMYIFIINVNEEKLFISSINRVMTDWCPTYRADNFTF